MIRKVGLLCVLGAAVLLLVAEPVSACRRGGSCCYPCYPQLCYPCWPQVYFPRFSFHCHFDKPSPYIPPDASYKLPLEVAVTNWEWYGWYYSNSEYQYYLFDQWGNQVPDHFVVTLQQQTILVPPRTSVLDRPGVYLKADDLQLGQPYTVVVCLRGHCCSFTVIPILESKKGKSAAEGSAKIVVTLPADAKLTIDGEETASTSEVRVFTTPPFPGDHDYYYTFKAEVVRNGAVQTITRRVTVRAGEESHVQLEVPDSTVAAK